MAAKAAARPTSPWEEFADAVLVRDGVLTRLRSGTPPADFAGLFIGDDEVDRILAELPGGPGEPVKVPARLAKRLDQAVAETREAFHTYLEKPDSLFGGIAWNAGLDRGAAEVFALLCAVESEPRRQRLIAYIQDNVTRPRATLATLRRLFPPPHPGARAVAPAAPLTRAELVRITGDGPWAGRMVAVPESVLWSLAGDASLDEDLPDGAFVVTSEQPGSGVAQLAMVSGADRSARLRAAFATVAGSAFVVTPMPATPEQWAAVVREATVAGLAIVVEAPDLSEVPAEAKARIERAAHLAWAISTRAEVAVDTVPELPWREVRVDEREATDDEWSALLSDEEPGVHPLNLEQLRLTALAYGAVGGDVDAAVRRLAGGKLDRLAVRIRPERNWDDLVVPPDQLSQLREMTGRYRHRHQVYADWGFRASPSAGVVALFAGPSGTGKTLTAEIIAGDLGLDLYKIDLSSVVSKYIGETEKNLESIFSAAAAGNLVLFFDEADSLFGKRSEVSDAHDRYANIEVSYLLQRMERYDGIVVLATNFQKNIDQAFLRRIHISVNFPMPEEDERRAIWKLSFPPEAPVTDIDFDFLAAQFKISGGSIRNAALNAAFLGAPDGQITMEHAILGLKREFQKLGRLRTEAEFDRYFQLVNGGGT